MTEGAESPGTSGAASTRAAAHARLMAHFDALCDEPVAIQSVRLDELREADPALAEAVGRLLAADKEPDNIMDLTGGAAKLAVSYAGVVVAGRWRLMDRLGFGGGGEVWRAEDLEGGPAVAVKFIDGALMGSPRQVRRFRREFRALLRLDHEGCLRVLGEGAVDPSGAGETPLGLEGRRYLVMEYLPGGDLTRLVGAPTDVLLGVVLQIAHALDYIHRQQIVHRDIKPTNVLLTADDPPRIKLADFGIIKLASASGSVVTGEGLLGTLDYLSPEQVRGEPADPRSDLYALGCLIHALWAGEVPFGGTQMGRLWARVSEAPPPLASRASLAPPGLCTLTDALLSTAAADRPQSAKEVAERVRELLEADPDGPRSAYAPLPVWVGTFLYPPGLVGRDGVIEKLRASAERVRDSGFTALTLVEGPAGVGKTALVTALSARLAGDGWMVLRVETNTALQAAPFAPFAAFEGQLAALKTAPSTWEGGAARPFSADARLRPDQEHLQAQRRLVDSIAGRLGALAADKPTCVVLEDCHDFGAGGAELLESLSRTLAAAAPRVFVIATTRPRARLVASALTDHITLGPLEGTDAVRVIARILGTSPAELPDALIAALVEEAQGNPLLLRTAVRNLVEAGGVRREADLWALTPDASPRAVVMSLLERRLAALSPATHELVAVAAVIGQRFDADLVAAAAGVDDEQLLDALVDGIQAAIFVPDADRRSSADAYRFDHARLRELVLGRLDDAQQMAIHDAVGDALSARGAPIASLAHHYGAGSDPRRAVASLEAAVTEAAAAHDQGTVARHLAQMLKRLNDFGEGDAEAIASRGRLTERRADALVLIGEYAEAARLLEALERDTADDVERGRFLRKRGLALLRTAEPGRGLVALQGAVTSLGDRTPRTRVGRIARLSWDFLATVLGKVLPARAHTALRDERASAHRELGLMYRWVDLYDSAAHLARFYRLSGSRAPTEYQVDANAMAAMLFALRSMPRAGDYVREKARELAQESGDIVGLTRLTIIQGACEAMLDDSETALARMDEGVALARQTADRWLLCFALSSRAWIRGLVGSVPLAHQEFVEAAALAHEIGAAWLEADAMSGGMLAALVIGRIGEGEKVARTLLSSDVRLAFPVFEQLAVEGMAGVAFLSGRFDTALVGYEHAHDLLLRHRLDEGWGWLVPMELIEAACCLADQGGHAQVPDLNRRLKRARRALRHMNSLPLYSGCLDVAKGVIASRRGNEVRALSRFDRAIATRGASRRSYIDTWMMVRPALERLYLGAPRDGVAAELDRVDREYEALGLEGLQGWLRIMRGIHHL